MRRPAIASPISSSAAPHRILCSIDVGHAEIEAAAKRSDCRGAVGLLDEPSALADPRYETPGGPEQTPFHAVFLQSGKLYAASR